MELVPVLIGFALGVAAARSHTGRARSASLAALGVGGAVMASWLSGELRESWLFVLVDAGLIALSATIGFGVARLRAARGVAVKP